MKSQWQTMNKCVFRSFSASSVSFASGGANSAWLRLQHFVSRRPKVSQKTKTLSFCSEMKAVLRRRKSQFVPVYSVWLSIWLTETQSYAWQQKCDSGLNKRPTGFTEINNIIDDDKTSHHVLHTWPPSLTMAWMYWKELGPKASSCWEGSDSLSRVFLSVFLSFSQSDVPLVFSLRIKWSFVSFWCCFKMFWGSFGLICYKLRKLNTGYCFVHSQF